MIDFILRHKFRFSIFVLFSGTLSQYLFLTGKTFSESVVSSIITFLSIIFGFYITSLAIFVTSQYVSSLYKIKDSKKTDQTLLHTLTENYNFGLVLTLISLGYFISLQLFSKTVGGQISFTSLEVLPFISIIVLDFIYCYLMLKDLISIIIQEGKSR